MMRVKMSKCGHVYNKYIHWERVREREREREREIEIKRERKKKEREGEREGERTCSGERELYNVEDSYRKKDRYCGKYKRNVFQKMSQ